MKYIFLMTLLFSGAVFSAPENPIERQQFTSSLNSMAMNVMGWYSCLLTKNNHCHQTDKINLLKKYRKQYPENITQIKITGTKLRPLNSAKTHYQFNVDLLIEQTDSDKKTLLAMSNQFIFGLNSSNIFSIENITSSKTKPARTIKGKQYTKSYFDHREIAYAWLSYLDGASVSPNLKQQFDQTHYTVTMGNKSWNGFAKDALINRNIHLAQGGHLLREVTQNPISSESGIYSIDLSIEWKGENKEHLSVLANIQQRLRYKILDNGDWEIISIEEKHLLPNNIPWMGLLC